jgi:hypothetical protein
MAPLKRQQEETRPVLVVESPVRRMGRWDWELTEVGGVLTQAGEDFLQGNA